MIGSDLAKFTFVLQKQHLPRNRPTRIALRHTENGSIRLGPQRQVGVVSGHKWILEDCQYESQF